jgi:hypothetical protein
MKGAALSVDVLLRVCETHERIHNRELGFSLHEHACQLFLKGTHILEV